MASTWMARRCYLCPEATHTERPAASILNPHNRSGRYAVTVLALEVLLLHRLDVQDLVAVEDDGEEIGHGANETDHSSLTHGTAKPGELIGLEPAPPTPGGGCPPTAGTLRVGLSTRTIGISGHSIA